VCLICRLTWQRTYLPRRPPEDYVGPIATDRGFTPASISP
jgi:hypothetical protein